MPFLYPHEVEENRKLGDILWRFNIAETSKSGWYTRVKPEYGQLTSQKTEKDCQKDPNPDVRYFVPIKKNKLVWSRAVKLDSGFYADTEAEACAYYYELVQQRIDQHLHAINELNKLLSDIPDECHPEGQAISLIFNNGDLKGEHMLSVTAPKGANPEETRKTIHDALDRIPEPQNGDIDRLCQWLRDVIRLKVTHIWSNKVNPNEQS